MFKEVSKFEKLLDVCVTIVPGKTSCTRGLWSPNPRVNAKVIDASLSRGSHSLTHSIRLVEGHPTLGR